MIYTGLIKIRHITKAKLIAIEVNVVLLNAKKYNIINLPTLSCYDGVYLNECNICER